MNYRTLADLMGKVEALYNKTLNGSISFLQSIQELIELEDDFCGYKGLRNLELSDVLEEVSGEAESQQAVKQFYRLKEVLKKFADGEDEWDL